MNRNLSKRPKVVRRLDGALTAWRYFHGPNVVHDVRAHPRFSAFSIYRAENEALFSVLVAFVKWMQAPILIEVWKTAEFVDETGRPIATNGPKIPWDPRPTSEILTDLGATVEKARSDIARAMSKSRPNSPFYTDET